MTKPITRQLISSKLLFIGFLIVIPLVVGTVFLTGLDVKRTILSNTILSIGILSIIIFSLLTIALYFGVKMKEDVGNLTKKIKFVEMTGYSGTTDFNPFEIGDGIEGILFSVLLWIVATIVLILLLFFFETILWASLMIIGALLYWIFYRAVKLVLYQGVNCKGNLEKSVWTSLKYTFLYSSWTFVVITGFYLWKK